VFAGGLVAYHSSVKHDVLHVPDGPVISPEAAAAMASGVARLLDTQVGVALTGVAGPEEQEGQPVGLVYGACAVGEACTPVRWQLPPGEPEEVREAAVERALVLTVRSVRDAG
jgi:nicotinamide-nucleotide amidase